MFFMLKIVIYDVGVGGEFFAEIFQEELPIAKIIRVINWRSAGESMSSRKKARKIAEQDLKPYIGRVDLIILANNLLGVTSIKYFKRKYKKQKFLGFNLPVPDTFKKCDTLILTTKALVKTINFKNYVRRIKRDAWVSVVDDYVGKIDDGISLENDLVVLKQQISIQPREIILLNANFWDIKEDLRKTFGVTIKIYDSFDDTMRQAFKILKIRGGIGRKKK